MRIEGRERVATAHPLAWQRINDPEVVRRCTPGLERLEETEPDHFEAVIELKLPAVRGRFEGEVEFLEREAPERLRLRVEAKGAPGFVHGEVTLRLSGAPDGTEFHYQAEIQVGGQIARFGQRMVSGIAKDMAAQFFRAFDRIDELAPGESAAPSALRAFLELVWRGLMRALGR